MAPSSSSTSSTSLLSNPNPDPVEEETLKRRRRSRRAFRMSREKQIPALSLHCASRYPACTSLKGELCSSFKEESDFQPNSHMRCTNPGHGEALARLSECSPGGAIVVYDGRMLKSSIEMGDSQAILSECSSGDGDVSDVGSDRVPDLFELRNWRNLSSSSSSSSTYEGPLNVTRAVSECSSDDFTYPNTLTDGNSIYLSMAWASRLMTMSLMQSASRPSVIYKTMNSFSLCLSLSLSLF